MKGKGIWILIGVLAIVLIILLLKGKSNATKSQNNMLPTSGTNAADMIASLAATTEGVPTASQCRQDCRQICKPLDDKLFGCGDRCQCKEDCKSACAKGLDYQSMFP